MPTKLATSVVLPPALDYELDTTAAVLTLSLAAGLNAIDNDTTPSLVIGGTIENGATVTLHDGADCSGSAIPYTGTGTITVSTALTTQKTYNFRIKHADSLGNVSCSTSALDYKLDTTDPATLTLSLAAGLNDIHNDPTPSLVIGGTIESGATITLHSNDANCSSSSAVSHTRTNNNITVSTLAEGIYNFRIKHADEAGNFSCSDVESYVLDLTPPAALTLSLKAGTTSPSNDTTPNLVIGGTIVNHTTVTLHDGADCTGSAISHTRTGNDITVSTALTTDKTYKFRIKYTDSAGNFSCSANALDYVLDTTPPAALTLSLASGTTSPSNDTTPSFKIGGNIVNLTTVTLHDGNDCSGANVGHSRTGYDITLAALTTDKTYKFRIKYTDSVGNFSCSTAALDYKLDTTAPAALTIALDGITSPNKEPPPLLQLLER